MLSSLGINTPLSIIGIISEISQFFNTSIAISGLYVSSFTFTIAICGSVAYLSEISSQFLT